MYINMEEVQKARLEQRGPRPIEVIERRVEAKLPSRPIPPSYQPYIPPLRISNEKAL